MTQLDVEDYWKTIHNLFFRKMLEKSMMAQHFSNIKKNSLRCRDICLPIYLYVIEYNIKVNDYCEMDYNINAK